MSGTFASSLASVLRQAQHERMSLGFENPTPLILSLSKDARHGTSGRGV